MSLPKKFLDWVQSDRNNVTVHKWEHNSESPDTNCQSLQEDEKLTKVLEEKFDVTERNHEFKARHVFTVSLSGRMVITHQFFCEALNALKH